MELKPPARDTKFRPPTPVGLWLTRDRLLRAVHDSDARKLLLIHAPAGYGKSTLAAQVLESESVRGRVGCAWLSLDADDNNTVWFLTHLVESLVLAGLELDGNLLSLLEERPDDAERFVVPALINSFERAGRGFLVCFDDWHVIVEKRTRQVLARLLEDSGDLTRFIVTSRNCQGLPLGRLRVYDQLFEVDARDLRFDVGESAEFFRRVKGIALTAEEHASLHASTEGWIAALQLTSLSLRGRADVPSLVKDLTAKRHGIGEYLAENVLDQLDAGFLEVLLAVSVTERLCAGLVEALAAQLDVVVDDALQGAGFDGQVFLETVLERDLFLQPLDPRGEWYRFHHLFADFLRERLLVLRGRAGVGVQHGLAARWFAGNGRISEAVDHALLAGDTGFALEVVESNAMPLVEHSRMSTLLTLVGKLPGECLLSRPALQIAVAWAYCLLHWPEESLEALELFEIALAADGEGVAGVVDVAAAQQLRVEALVVRRCLDLYADRVDYSDQLERDVFARAEGLRPWAVSVGANIATFDLLYRGRRRRALALQDWAAKYHGRVQGPFSEVYGACFAAIVLHSRLQFARAEEVVRGAYELGVRQASAQAHAARLPEGILGFFLYNRGEFEEAERLMVDALKLGPRAGVVDFTMPPYVGLSRLFLCRGERARAHDVLCAARQTAAQLGLLRLTQASKLEHELQGVGDLCASPDPPVPLQLGEHHVWASEVFGLRLRVRRALLVPPVRGGVEAAAVRADARELVRLTGESGDLFAWLLARVELAAVLECFGDREAALLEIVEPVALLASGGQLRPLVDAGVFVRPLLEVLCGVDGGVFFERVLASGGLGGVDVSVDADAGVDVDAGVGADVNVGVAGVVPLAVTPFPVWPEVSEIREFLRRVLLQPPLDGAQPVLPKQELSEREREILRLVSEGKSNSQIAKSLYISSNTVKWYLRGLFRVFGVADRAECARFARENGLL